jgi:hypothetical protein
MPDRLDERFKRRVQFHKDRIDTLIEEDGLLTVGDRVWRVDAPKELPTFVTVWEGTVLHVADSWWVVVSTGACSGPPAVVPRAMCYKHERLAWVCAGHILADQQARHDRYVTEEFIGRGKLIDAEIDRCLAEEQSKDA